MIRRLRHVLFPASAFLFLLLSVATAALWVRSRWQGDTISWSRWQIEPALPGHEPFVKHEALYISAGRGGINAGRLSTGNFQDLSLIVDGHTSFEEAHPKTTTPSSDFRHWSNANSNYPKLTGDGSFYRRPFFVFSLAGHSSQGWHIEWEVTFPLWLLVVLFLLIPGAWTVHSRRRRRIQYRLSKSLCAGCGYDLRASKDKCPECGTPIPAAPPSPS